MPINRKRKVDEDIKSPINMKQEPIDLDSFPSPLANKKLKPTVTHIKEQSPDTEVKHLVKDEIDSPGDLKSQPSPATSPTRSSPETPIAAKTKKRRGGGVFLNPDGEQYIELGPRRRATVRQYNGRTLVDLREFYEQDGDKKPGKKGISLTLDQWKCLATNVGLIDTMIEQASSS